MACWVVAESRLTVLSKSSGEEKNCITWQDMGRDFWKQYNSYNCKAPYSAIRGSGKPPKYLICLAICWSVPIQRRWLDMYHFPLKQYTYNKMTGSSNFVSGITCFHVKTIHSVTSFWSSDTIDGSMWTFWVRPERKWILASAPYLSWHFTSLAFPSLGFLICKMGHSHGWVFTVCYVLMTERTQPFLDFATGSSRLGHRNKYSQLQLSRNAAGSFYFEVAIPSPLSFLSASGARTGSAVGEPQCKKIYMGSFHEDMSGLLFKNHVGFQDRDAEHETSSRPVWERLPVPLTPQTSPVWSTCTSCHKGLTSCCRLFVLFHENVHSSKALTFVSRTFTQSSRTVPGV